MIVEGIWDESVTCHQIDSTMREKIQASTFSNADMNTFGSSQLPIPPQSKAVFSLFLGENPLHINCCVTLPFPSPFFLFVLDPAGLNGVLSLVVLLIIVLSTIELDNQNVNLCPNA